MSRREPALFPGWRMSPSGERRLFEREEDVPEGWYREGGDPPRGGAGAVSPGEPATAPAAGRDHPAPAAVPRVVPVDLEIGDRLERAASMARERDRVRRADRKERNRVAREAKAAAVAAPAEEAP